MKAYLGKVQSMTRCASQSLLLAVMAFSAPATAQPSAKKARFSMPDQVAARCMVAKKNDGTAVSNGDSRRWFVLIVRRNERINRTILGDLDTKQIYDNFQLGSIGDSTLFFNGEALDYSASHHFYDSHSDSTFTKLGAPWGTTNKAEILRVSYTIDGEKSYDYIKSLRLRLKLSAGPELIYQCDVLSPEVAKKLAAEL